MNSLIIQFIKEITLFSTIAKSSPFMNVACLVK